MNQIFKELFNYHGRFNRAKYWGYTIGFNVFTGIFSMVYSLLLGENASSIPPALVSLLMLYPMICLVIKRSHDLDKSGLFALLYLVPIVNLYPMVLFLFFKGTDGPNKYGPDPLQESFIQETA